MPSSPWELEAWANPNYWGSGHGYFLGVWVAVGDDGGNWVCASTFCMDAGFAICCPWIYRACSGRITAWKRPEKCVGCPPLPESSLAPVAQPALLLSAFQRLLVFSHSSLRGAATKPSSSHRRGKRNGQQLHGREEPCHLPTARSVRPLFPFCGCTTRTE